MSILRIYDPGECDESGTPLDWERCRACAGTGGVVPLDERGGPMAFGRAYRETYEQVRRGDAAALGDVPTSAEVMRQERASCAHCEGHGSLKAAALAEMIVRYPRSNDTLIFAGRAWLVGMTRRKPLTTSVGGLAVEGRYDRGWVTLHRDGEDTREVAIADLPSQPIRCEDCGHPQSEGTWENGGAHDAPPMAFDMWQAETAGHDGQTFYSPCDEGCRHIGGGLRMPDGAGGWESEVDVGKDWPREWAGGDPREHGVEASWRQVDVRTLGWPADLRPERLAVLCLRCLARR